MTSRATSHEHHAPKLPSRSPDEVEAAFVAANATPAARVEPPETGQRPPAGYENPVLFEAPELLKLRAVSIVWTAARVAIVMWTAAIMLVAIRTANRIDGAASDRSIADAGDDMTIVVLVGVVLVAALFAMSVVWSRKVAENTRRLRGRWPSVNRATRVWFYPTVWVTVSALTFLRVEVTEFDPLPAVAATVFAITLYSPYSMIQRIFKTLTRLRPEGEIRAAYLLDLAGFGIIWWRLTDWPDPITATDSGTVDAMAWAGITSSGLLLISAGITANLARQTIAAQRYRIRVLATRHVQGLALPLIPRKAWGRERTSIDDAAARGAGPVGDVVRAADLVIGPGGAPSAAVVAARRTVVPGRGADVAAPSTATPTGDRPAPRRTLAAGGAEPTTPRVAARAGETPVARRRPGPGAAGQVAARRRPGPAREGNDASARRRPGGAVARGGGPQNPRPAVAGGAGARRQPGAAKPRAGARSRRPAVPGAAGAAVARRRAASTATKDTATRRPLAAARRAAAADPSGDAVDRSGVRDVPGSGVVDTARRSGVRDVPGSGVVDTARRSGVRDVPGSGVGDAADRSGVADVAGSGVGDAADRSGVADVAGSGVGDAADRSGVARRRSSTAEPGPSPRRRQEPSREVRASVPIVDADEPPEPATFFEALRFAALGAHVALAATFVWFVVESRRAAASSGGILDPTHIDRLDLVRTANVVALAVTVLLLGAWGAAMSIVARDSDRRAPPPWLVAAMCVPATLLAIGGLVVDGRVGDGILFTLAMLAAGLGGACSLALLSGMSRGVDVSSHGMQIWAAVIAVVGVGLTIGGYMQPIEPDDSLTTLTLVAVLTSILVGLAVLLGALASHELDDVVVGGPPADADGNG